ncbi:MAG: cytochrome P450 [Leptolyngbya sp. BL-A-14]
MSLTNLPEGPSLPSLLQTLALVAQPIAFLERCAQRYGDTFTTRVLGWQSPPVVFLSDPAAIAQIFTAPVGQFELGKVTHVFRPLTGDQSLMMLDGERHQQQRQLLMPPLHGDRMRTYGQLICDLTRQVVGDWTLHQSFSIQASALEISLQVILRVVFGMSPGSRYQELKQLLHDLLESVTSPLYSSQFFFPLLQQNLGAWSPWGAFLQQQQKIDALVYAEIQERRSHFDPSREDVLTLLLSARDEAGQTMTDEELRDQLMTLLLLGHETTASALSWAFYWVHREPSVLQRLRQELDPLGNKPDPDRLAQLPYLTAVCKESLRIYPIALISQPRKVKQAITIGSHTFAPGSILIPCIYLAHRRAQTYPQPDRFLPDRFLQQKFSPSEFLPFGGGLRSCIGAAFALYEMKLVLATVLACYDLSLVQQGSIQPERRGITFVPSKNFRLSAIACRNTAVTAGVRG